MNLHNQPRSSQEEILLFFNKIKIIQTNTIPETNLIFMHKVIFHQMMKNTIIKIINDFTQAKDLVLTVLANQIFSNHTHETNNYDHLEIIQHLRKTIFKNEIQLTHNHTNQLKSITKFYCHIIYNNMK